MLDIWDLSMVWIVLEAQNEIFTIGVIVNWVVRIFLVIEKEVLLQIIKEVMDSYVVVIIYHIRSINKNSKEVVPQKKVEHRLVIAVMEDFKILLEQLGEGVFVVHISFVRVEKIAKIVKVAISIMEKDEKDIVLDVKLIQLLLIRVVEVDV